LIKIPLFSPSTCERIHLQHSLPGSGKEYSQPPFLLTGDDKRESKNLSPSQSPPQSFVAGEGLKRISPIVLTHYGGRLMDPLPHHYCTSVGKLKNYVPPSPKAFF